MANFHLSVKTVSRSAGRTATASAAYRAGEKIIDERTGEIHDYARKSGVESATLFLPVGAPEMNRAELWNAAEKSETRKNSTVAREFEVALPSELSADQRRELAHDFTKALVQKYGFAADCAIHLPGKDGDSRNHHAHILCTTRKLTPDGFGEKTRVLDDHKTGAAQVVAMREKFAELTNAALEKAGHTDRVSHLSLKAQGIEREPTMHLGPTATAIERRGEVSQKTMNRDERQIEVAQKAQAAAAALAAELAAAQAQAAEAAREAIRAAQETAALAAAQAQREAAAAKAAHDLEIATLAKQEKEDESIRAKTLAALGRSSAATGRAIAFTGADHAAVEKSLDASGAAGIETKRNLVGSEGCLVASAEHLTAVQSVTRGIGRNTESIGRNTEIAAKGAERRVARSHLESSVTAVGKQLGSVNHVLQQLVDRLPAIVKSIASASRAVAQRFIERVAKASEQPQQAAPVAAKAITAAVQEKPPEAVLRDVSAFDKTGLRHTGDLDLVQRAKELFSQNKPDSFEQYTLFNDISKAMGSAVGEIRVTEPKANQFGVEHAIKQEQNTAARNAGQPEPWKAEQTSCTWDTMAFMLERERKQHLETKRPSGMFSGAAAKEYDTKTAGLTSQIDNITRATITLKAQLVEKVAEQAQQAAQKGPQHADAQERHAGLTRLHKAVTEAAKQIEAQQEKTHERSRGIGR